MVARQTVVFALGCWVGLALALPRPGLAAPTASCRAERAGQRALIRAEVRELLEPELLRLVELGLVGRLRVEAVLFRRRQLWFDQRVAEQVAEWPVRWSREERALLIGSQPASPQTDGSLTLPVLSLRPDGFTAAGHYVEINLRLEVVTSTSLAEVARWLVTGADNTVPRALVNYLAADLARTSHGRCPVEQWPAAADRRR